MNVDIKVGDLLRNMMYPDRERIGGFVLFRSIKRRGDFYGELNPEGLGMIVVAGRELGEVWTVIETHRSWCKVADPASGTVGWLEMANGPCRSQVFERLLLDDDPSNEEIS